MAQPFKRGDIVVWDHPQIGSWRNGSLAIVVEQTHRGVTVNWLIPHPDITHKAQELSHIPDWLNTGWDEIIFKKIGHLDDF